MDPDELLKNAKALSKQMSEYQGILPPDPPVSKQCSEAAWEELLVECDEQFNYMQQLQNDIAVTDADSSENQLNETENRINTLTAELKQWEESEPRLLSVNPEVLLSVGREELSQLNAQLEMVLSCCQAKRDKLREILKSERKWLEEKEEVLRAATEQVKALQEENERLSETSVLLDMKKKLKKMKDFQDNLLSTLSDILQEHFPLPQEGENGNKRKKKFRPEPRGDLISLHDILELLMNKTVETPHEPYVVMNESFWPPYIEMLLRYGIASRHPDDSVKIRLESFY
ncbi:centromere protein K [Paramormyrops kingsleyae]|uniref:Centromere protein K n=1 Tax=Paramormyrops kingsleyae TaxID=1676925 RepID=A0A3B3R801_9TELE|nr:centromere protein K [Paramormyrops kingsleyae]